MDYEIIDDDIEKSIYDDMGELLILIDLILDGDISYNLEHFDYEVLQYVDYSQINFNKIIEHLEGSKILRYDSEHNSTIMEIIGGYLIIRIEEVFNYVDVHICYCRHSIGIPRALRFITA